MFEYLNKYKKIIVTGPHRSGTRICGRMISYDLGYPFVDEEDIHMDSLYSFSHYLFSDIPLVIQCPALNKYIHYFNSENRAVIFMKRGKQDIISSQERIEWSWEWLERLRYNETKGEISEIKKDFWKTKQKKELKNGFVIDFKSLSEHPLWIEKENRTSFSPVQFSKKGIPINDIKGLYPYHSPGVSFKFLEDKRNGILMNSKMDIKQINSTGVEIWQKCDGKTILENMHKTLFLDFGNQDEIQIIKDTMNFISELAMEGYIQLLKISSKQ